MKLLEKFTNTNWIFVNSDSACENNCAWCDFWVKKADVNNKKSINELKLIIDNINEKINYWENIIFQPWNILLEHNIKDIEELFTYSFNRTWKQSQWEIAKLDERILDFLDSEIIQNLISENKLFLNIWYLDENLDLLKKVFTKILIIWRKKRREEINLKWFEKDFDWLSYDKYFNKLTNYTDEWKLEWFDFKKSIRFAMHNLWELSKWNEKTINDILNFLDFAWIELNKEELLEKNSIWFYNIEWWIWIRPIILEENKIKNWVVVWNDMNEKWNETCILLNDQMELDITWDMKVRSHINPCNKIDFWDIVKNSSEEIDKYFQEHISRVTSIIIKYKFKDWFNQSELCKMCLNGEKPELYKMDIFNYIVRQKIHNFKNKFSKILFK